MNTLKEIVEIFEARKEKEINEKLQNFYSINAEITLLKNRIKELEEMKYKILLND